MGTKITIVLLAVVAVLVLYVVPTTQPLILGLGVGLVDKTLFLKDSIVSYASTNPFLIQYGIPIALGGTAIICLAIGAKVGVEGWKKATGWGASRVNTLLQKNTSSPSSSDYNPAVTSPAPAPAVKEEST